MKYYKNQRVRCIDTICLNNRLKVGDSGYIHYVNVDPFGDSFIVVFDRLGIEGRQIVHHYNIEPCEQDVVDMIKHILD